MWNVGFRECHVNRFFLFFFPCLSSVSSQLPWRGVAWRAIRGVQRRLLPSDGAGRRVEMNGAAEGKR